MVHLLAPLPYAAEAAWLMLLLYISKAGKGLGSGGSYGVFWWLDRGYHEGSLLGLQPGRSDRICETCRGSLLVHDL